MGRLRYTPPHTRCKKKILVSARRNAGKERGHMRYWYLFAVWREIKETTSPVFQRLDL
jgi:hypothetical protein